MDNKTRTFRAIETLLEWSKAKCFGWNLDTGMVRVSKPLMTEFGIPFEEETLAIEKVLANRGMHEESQTIIRNLMEAKLELPYTGNTLIKFSNNGTDYSVYSVLYMVYYDDENDIPVCVGVFRNIESVEFFDLKFNFESRGQSFLADDLKQIFILNVSANKVVSQINRETGVTIENPYENYEDLLSLIKENSVDSKENREAFKAISEDRVFEYYQDYKDNRSVDIAYKGTKEGEINWCSWGFKNAIHPQTGDVYIFIHKREINIIKEWEMATDVGIEPEGSLGAYSRNGIEKMANYANTAISKEESCALVTMYLVGFDKVKNNIGTIRLLNLLEAIAVKISRSVSTHNLITYDDKGRFCIYFTKLTSGNEINKRMRRLLDFIFDPENKLLGDEVFCEFRYKVAYNYSGEISFKRLYEENNRQIEKEIGRGTEETGNEYEALREEGLIEEIIETYRDNDIDPYEKVLQLVGEFYKASRVYIAEIDEEADTTSVYHEWFAEGATPIAGDVQDYDFNKTPTIKNAYYSRSTLELWGILENMDIVTPQELVRYRAQNVDNLVMVFVRIPRIFSGFIGVDNGGLSRRDIALLTTICHFISGEIARSRMNRDELSAGKDELTGVYGYNRYSKYIEHFDPEEVEELGCFVISPTNLREINKIYGITVGNNILKEIANDLAEIRVNSKIFRYSGSVFVLICENISEEEYEEIGKKINKLIGEEKNFVVSALKKYISNTQKLSEEIEVLIDKQVYSRTRLNESLAAKRKREGTLEIIQSSIENMWLRVHYQPSVDAETKEIVGLEALCRLDHPEYGEIPPGRFIPLLEKTKTIDRIDLYVLEEACKTICKMKELGKRIVPVSINLSHVTVMSTGLLYRINGVVNKYKVDKKFIMLEVRESFTDTERDRQMGSILREIMEDGYNIIIDDFGFKNVDVDKAFRIDFKGIKINRKLIDGMLADDRAKYLVKAILGYAKTLDVRIFAEGVETEEQVSLLEKMACDYLQGFYIDKPLTEEEVLEKYFK